jgi:hypothetical protein
VSDELERRLKQFPSEFPRPDEEVTRRVADRLRTLTPRQPRRAAGYAAALVVALAAGAVIGSVATPASTSTVTMGVRPTVVPYSGKPEIFGAVTNAKAGETVTVQFRQCGLYPAQFRDFMTTQTIEGGAWSLQELLGVRLQIPASGSFRALWGNETSREVELKMRVGVGLRRLPRGRGFYVGVAGAQSFWHRRVRVEHFDSRSRRWRLVRSLLLTDSGGFRGSGEATVLSNTEPFRLSVPKGTTLRAVLPLAAARPCYLAGYSKLVRA